MSTTLVKQPAFIAPPPGKTDVASGMQKAASGSIIGRSAAPATPLSGQDIGKAAAAGYTVVTVTP